MKVLFITHLREQSDWSRTAIDYINAMESAGIDVVVRDVCLNPANRDSKVPMNIAGLEWKPIDDCDVCIQNVLPHLISYSDRFAKNIAMFSVEASTLKDSFWFKPLEMMDEIWVNNNELRTNLIGDGINAKVRFVPPPSDTDSLKSDQKLIEDNTFKLWLKIEIAACTGWNKLGVISEKELEKIKKAKFNKSLYDTILNETKHDMVSFTRSISDSLGEESRWIHHGLTSKDV